MSFRSIVYAYVLGGLTFFPLVILSLIAFAVYTSVPLGDIDPTKPAKEARAHAGQSDTREVSPASASVTAQSEQQQDEKSYEPPPETPKARKGWLTVRRTLEETTFDGSYVNLVRSFLDARSKDPKRSRPRDTWYVVLKGKVLYLYEDESMTECEAAIELGGHEVTIVHEDDKLTDGELFAKRNAICLRPKIQPGQRGMPSVTREMFLERDNVEEKVEEKVANSGKSSKKKQKEREREREKMIEIERRKDAARQEALDMSTPWYIFVRSNFDMEDWYLALVHASDYSANTPLLTPLEPVFSPDDMKHLVATLDEQPDVIPTRWLNALIGRIFFSYYRTDTLESGIIAKLMKKLSKVKKPNFLSDIIVTEVSVGDRSPMFSKPMLKELTKEGDAALEVRIHYKGEIRIQIEAIATLNLGARFKPYTVPLALAVVLHELEGNMVVRVKRPPSNRIWYAFTQMPKMQMQIVPGVSDRRITWSMILNSIESRLKEVIMESVVLPNMDDIAFFDSSPYKHRGGIFPDAARNQRRQGGMEGEEEDTSSPDVETSPDGEATGLKRSHSDGEIAESIEAAKNSQTRSTTMAAPVPSQDTLSTSPSNNDPWLSASSSTVDANHLMDDPEPLPDAEDGSRREGMPRVNTPTNELPPTPVDGPPRKLNKKPSKFLTTARKFTRSRSPSPSVRSVRSRASSRSPSPSPSFERPPADPMTVSSSSASTKSDKSSDHKSINSNNTFLSTLKTRAADRQALGQSAKETMRKWGVNWTGLKKENGSGYDTPDGGSVHRRMSSDSSSSINKPKASYAEVRAHVASRRSGGASSNHASEPGPADQLPSSVSTPIVIPDSKPIKDRTVSISSEGGSSEASYGAPSSPVSSFRGRPLSKGDMGPAYQQHRKGVSPTPQPTLDVAERTREGSADSRSKATSPAPDRPDDSPLITSPPMPIHTQPSQVQVMSIPGIHASHRGEVMSMGYVPPSPPSVPSENKAKAPAGIQSFSRLFNRGPISTSESASVSSAPADMDALVEDQQQSQTPTPPAKPSKPRRAPPPLPPRSISTLSGSPSATSPTQSSLASASESLRSIASKDDELKRASLEMTRSPLTVHVDEGEEDRKYPSEAPSSGMSSGSLDPNSTSSPDITFTAPTPIYPELQKPPLPPRRSTVSVPT